MVRSRRSTLASLSLASLSLPTLTAALVVAALVGTGAVDYHWGLLVGAGIAGLAELLPLRLDDNLSVPLVSGAAMHLLGA